MTTKMLIKGKDGTVVVPKSTLGMPKFVNHKKDFGAHHGFMADSQFVAAEMKTEDGVEFGFMFHAMLLNPEKDPDTYPLLLSIITLSDYTNCTYTAKEDNFFGDQFSFSWDEMNVKSPISYIKGTPEKVECGTDLPDGRGRIEVTLERTGPILDNCSVGAFPFLNGTIVTPHFALCTLKAKGRLTLDGETKKISGEAWLDRQWTDLSQEYIEKKFRWIWMNLNLENGYRISVWDVLVHEMEEHAWVTVLTPDGAYHIGDMVPLAKYASDFWTSPVTGQIYPTKYKVKVPSLNIDIDVVCREGLPHQEIVSPSGDNKWEGGCLCSGICLGEKVTGHNYVELVGSFAK